MKKQQILQVNRKKYLDKILDGLNGSKPQIFSNIIYKQKLKILTKNEKFAHLRWKYVNSKKPVTHF